MNRSRIHIAAWCFLLAAVPAVFAGCGKSESPSPTGREGKMVCVDTATKEAIVMPVADTFPAPNPRTGKRTMMPAMYCLKCARWHPVPPPDQINRTPKATTCPKTGTPLTLDGPWPEEESTASARAGR
ncbi:MAG: hypothetical protein GXX96_06245 [Planctomycetaceae bacterium]|nr:hypothetical protein [Planctomycetaceae bacterium]